MHEKEGQIKIFVPLLHQSHFKCSIAVCGQWQLYCTVQIQNISIITESSIGQCSSERQIRDWQTTISVLVSLGGYDRGHGLGSLSKHLFLTVLEAGKSRVTVQADSVSSESSLPDLQTATFSLYPHMVEREDSIAGMGTMGIWATPSCNSLVPSRPAQPYHVQSTSI